MIETHLYDLSWHHKSSAIILYVSVLLYFLKIPAESDLGDNMADLILQSYIEEGDTDKLESLVKNHFNNIYGPTNTPWRLRITTPSDRLILFTEGGIQKKTGGFRASRLTTLQHHTVVIIPSYGVQNYMQIKFSLGTLKPKS